MGYVMVSKRIVRREITLSIAADGAAFDHPKIFVTWEILKAGEHKGAYDAEFFKRIVKKIEGVSAAPAGADGRPIADQAKECSADDPEFIAAFLGWEDHVSVLQAEYIKCTIGAARGN